MTGPKKKIYISLLIFGIIYAVMSVLIIYPLYGGIKKDSEDFMAQKEKLISFPDEIKNLQESEKFYKANEENLEKINTLFINREIPIEFISFLEKTAAESQLESEVSLASAGAKETDPWPSLIFQIQTAGSFSNFSKFLQKIENSHYLTEIINANIVKAGNKKGTELPATGINATLSIKVFSR